MLHKHKKKKQLSVSELLKLAYNRSSEFVEDLLQGPEGIAKFVEQNFLAEQQYLDHQMPWTNGTWDKPGGNTKPTTTTGSGKPVDFTGSTYNPYVNLDFTNTGSSSGDTGTVAPYDNSLVEVFSKPTAQVADKRTFPKALPGDATVIGTVVPMRETPVQTLSSGQVMPPSTEGVYMGSFPLASQGWGVGVKMSKGKGKKKNKQKQVNQTKEAKKLFKKLTNNSTYNNNEFGPVTSLTSAPVAIGNSIRGTPHRVTPMKNGIVVVGRDYMFPLKDVNIASGINWLLTGGTPLTPTAFGSTCLANYSRMYAKFRIKKFVVHYITSSATSAVGDIMFYHAKNRDSPFVQVTSPNLVPVVLSDPSTVMGPLWVNHSAKMWVTGDWKSLDYGMHCGSSEYSDGEMFVLRKSANPCTNSGYVIFDYKIEFAELQLSPRNLSYPIPKIQYTNIPLVIDGGTGTADKPISGNTGGIQLVASGNDISGSAFALPSGIANGDIFKCIVDLKNSSLGAYTESTIFQTYTNASSSSGFTLTLVDGSTFYLCYDASSKFAAYATIEEAFSQTSCMLWATTQTTTISLQVWISYVGSAQQANINPNMS